ncbi:ABC transporter ATP-binding protein [Roseibium sediminis]|uniref:ABC transporter ATP-binding protein n=1 Tax=Roseibium sediminis TaxID=1775174 RepID=UPI0013762CFF|nr:ABC transporter ATP-binding protein [Roseibium sediminis]
MQQDESVIRLENVGKCYRIFARPQDRFKQALRERFGGFFGTQSHEPLYREHWALRDVSFEIAPGEAVGILGRNGAGKSTLLQIVAGTLPPTTGQVQTAGRITALLELGSGFNPEFTGRENVFHNAQILGLSREETENKYDDIASFADIGEFIDQPVKTYSSGMMMRLAFAVQTAVEPRILIVDEALSVGDMFFQSKCMARINKLVDSGVSLLFVSHDIASIRHLCRRAVLMANGRMEYFGDVAEATSRYERLYLSGYNDRAAAGRSLGDGEKKREELALNVLSAASGSLKLEQDARTGCDLPALSESYRHYINDNRAFAARCGFQRVGNGEAKLINVVMVGERGQTDEFEFGEQVVLLQVVEFAQDTTEVNVSYKIRTRQGTGVVFGDTRMFGDMSRFYRAGRTYVLSWSFELRLGHDTYFVQSVLAHPPRQDADWEFIDMVPLSNELRVLPRKAGMIDGLVAWNADHSVYALPER